MSQKAIGGKFLRLVNIITNQPDRLRLIAKMKSAYADATAIDVKDIGGLCFDYTPKVNLVVGKTLRIPKKVVENFNADLIEAAGQGPAPDLDSLETLKAQLDNWIDLSVHGEGGAIGDSDLLEIIATSGKPEDGRFIYNYTKDGSLVPGVGRQKRFTNLRTDIATLVTGTISDDKNVVIVDNGVVVSPTANRLDIIATIIKAASNPDVPSTGADSSDYADAFLFPEDIDLPVTHFKHGITYIAKINSYALDYHGEISFKFANMVNNNLTVNRIGNTLSLEFDRPVFYNGKLLGDHTDTPVQFVSNLLRYLADATLLPTALVPADVAVDITDDKTIKITVTPGFFTNDKFKALDTDKDGVVALELVLNLTAFESVDEGRIVVSNDNVNLTVSSDLVGTANPPFSNQNYTDTITQGEFAVARLQEG